MFQAKVVEKITMHVFGSVPFLSGTRGGVVVEALHYKPEGRGFDSPWCHWIFSLT
jgi:hypothetical protein